MNRPLSCLAFVAFTLSFTVACGPGSESMLVDIESESAEALTITTDTGDGPETQDPEPISCENQCYVDYGTCTAALLCYERALEKRNACLAAAGDNEKKISRCNSLYQTRINQCAEVGPMDADCAGDLEDCLAACDEDDE